MWNIQLPTSSKSITLTSLSPVSANAGDPAFLLTATGNNFTAQSVINFNGTALTTTFVNAMTLTATVPTSQIPCAGPLFVSVTDPVEGSTAPLRFTVGGGCDFSLTATPVTQTVSPGAIATYQIVVNTTGTTANPVQLSCPAAPAGITCQFSVNPVTPVQGGTTVTLTIDAPALATLPGVRPVEPDPQSRLYRAAEISAAMLAVLGLTFPLALRAHKKSAQPIVRFALSVTLLFFIALLAACGGGGGGGGGGGKTQTFTIQIQGVSQNFQHLTSVQLVVD
jgi:hypothetical protein